jgi:hypothetical protein
MNRRRLEGEAIRDAMLAVSGTLTQRRGGPGVRPPLPPELLKTVHQGHWVVSPDPLDHTRRSLYLFVRRNLRYPMFEVFDRPDTNASCPRRNQSTIAPQALTLLNSKVSLDAAEALSGRLLRETGGDQERCIALAYRLTLGRQPTDEDRAMVEDFLERDLERIKQSGRSPDELALPKDIPPGVSPSQAATITDLCLALFNLNEFIYID